MLAEVAEVVLCILQAQPEVVDHQAETAQKIALRVLLERQILEVGQEVMPLV
jgi:hypothetical protein